MKYFGLTAAFAALSAEALSPEESAAALVATRQKFNDVHFETNHFPSKCDADGEFGSAIWRFRRQVRTKSWCDDNCRTELKKADAYIKLMKQDSGPYACDYKFNPKMQDILDHWAHQMIDNYPQAEDLWFNLVSDFLFGNDSCWERNMFNFRQWQDVDINAKEFYYEAAKVQEAGNGNFGAAYGYWVGNPNVATDGFRGAKREQIKDNFLACVNAGDNPPAWHDILADNYGPMLNILGQSAGDIMGSSENVLFMFRLTKMLDRLSQLGAVTDILTAAGNVEAAAFLQQCQLVEFNSAHWNDFEAGAFNGQLSLNAFDFWDGLQCQKAIPAVQAAYQALATAFSE